MYTEVLRSIDGISIYPVVALVAFVVVFGAVLFVTARLTAGSLREYAAMPLDLVRPHLEGDRRDREEA